MSSVTEPPTNESVPRVSVVMPVMNGERFLGEAIQSILDQSLRDLELIVVVNGSTDTSANIASRFAANDSRVRVIQLPEGNISRALNTGIWASRAPWVARMDADDIALPRRLERQLQVLDEHPEVAALGTWGWRIGETGKKVSEFRVGPTSRKEFEQARNEGLIYLLSPSVVFSRQVAMKLDGFRVDYPTAQDVEFWSRIADDHVVMAIPEMLVLYRVHGTSISTTSFNQQMQNAKRARTNIFRRRAGMSELTTEQFLAIEREQVFMKRWIQDRKTKSQLYYRRGGGMLAARNPRGLVWLLGSVLLYPPLPLRRLRRQAVLPMMLSRIDRKSTNSTTTEPQNHQ